jgi:quinol monooxygenase YgiN
MLVRIVKMSFKRSKVEEFIENFNQNKQAIRDFKGCDYLELHRDRDHSNVFFTYSYWQSEADLNSYRNSELFKQVWSKTKVLFDAQPQAWSLDRLYSVK